MNIRNAAMLCAAIPLCACATVTRGKTEAMVIQTTPPGALVTMTNEKMEVPVTCTTPCSVKMKRKRGFDVAIEREGYETVNTRIDTQVSGGGAAGMAGNVLLGGVIGAVVDGTSGAMNEFAPNPLVVTLVPVQGPVPDALDTPEPVLETMAPKAEEPLAAELGS